MPEQNNSVHNFDVKTNLKGSYLLGAIGSILGALLGAIPWALAYYFGWFVGWLGFLIGICAVKGYGILRGKTGWPAVFIIVFSVILGVITGQMLGDFMEIGKMIANGDINSITYSDIPKSYFFVLMNNSEALLSTLGNLGLGLVFACLGVWSIIKKMISDLKEGKQNCLPQTDSEQADAPDFAVATSVEE